MHEEIKNLMKTQTRTLQKLFLITNNESELCLEENEVKEIWLPYIEEFFKKSKIRPEDYWSRVDFSRNIKKAEYRK